MKKIYRIIKEIPILGNIFSRFIFYNRKIFKKIRQLFYKRGSESTIDKIDINNLTIYYRKETADENVISHSFENDIFMPVINNHVEFSPEDVVFDLGAHIGTLSILLSKLLIKGQIYSFEASKSTFEILKINVKKNRLQNIKIINKAVTKKSGRVKLYKSIDGNWGDSIFTKNFRDYEFSESVSLDDFINENELSKIKLVKMNIEGAEFEIINNLSSSSFAIIENFLILYHLDLDKTFDLSMITSNLEKHGFAIHFYHKSTIRGWIMATKK